jgi:hypothetical protein
VVRTWCDGELVEVATGSWLSLPRARPHAQLAIGPTPARVIAVYRNTHFADFIAAVGVPSDRPRPPPGPPSPPDLLRLVELAAAHHLRILGPPPPALIAGH